MRESEVEAYFVKRVREALGLQRKFVSPGHRGVPDRIVCFPEGRFSLVELKRPSKGAEPHQKREHMQWIKVGCIVWIIDTKEKVDSFIDHMTR